MNRRSTLATSIGQDYELYGCRLKKGDRAVVSTWPPTAIPPPFATPPGHIRPRI